MIFHRIERVRILMQTEIELKLLVAPDAEEIIANSLIPGLNASTKVETTELFNAYYDTPNKTFRNHDIGYRVRGKNGSFEQTVKTKGTSVGGLHKRPEYNIPLDNNVPDITLFAKELWPEEFDLLEIQAQMEVLFTTHFHRTTYHIVLPSGTQLELVFDSGKVESEQHKAPICEVELELIEGDVLDLFAIAEKLFSLLPARMGILSKAARGYMLAEGNQIEPQQHMAFNSVDVEDTVEKAFTKILEYSLGVWQEQIQNYLDTKKIKGLVGIVTAMNVLLQSLSLYLPLLQCGRLLDLHRRMLAVVTEWYWVEQLRSYRELTSKRGFYHKRLSKEKQITSLIKQKSADLLAKHKPEEMLLSSEINLLQLQLTQMLIDKPWRRKSDTWQSAVIDHARGWLAQGWHNITQTMPRKKKLTAENYISGETLMKQTLYNGLCLAGLYPEDERSRFRAPWLDMLSGIDELHTLALLKSELISASLESEEVNQQWCDEKMDNLLRVMEQSRNVALKMEPYW